MLNKIFVEIFIFYFLKRIEFFLKELVGRFEMEYVTLSSIEIFIELRVANLTVVHVKDDALLDSIERLFAEHKCVVLQHTVDVEAVRGHDGAATNSIYRCRQVVRRNVATKRIISLKCVSLVMIKQRVAYLSTNKTDGPQ